MDRIGPSGRAAALLAVAVLIMLACAGRALATPTWLPAVNLATPADDVTVNDLDSVVAPDGSVVVAWQRDSGGAQTIVVSTRRPDGSVTDELLGPGRSPSLGVDGSGTVTIAYVLADNATIQTFVRPSGGAFGSAQRVKDGGATISNGPELAVAGSGRAVVAWSEGSGTLTPKAAVREGASFGSPQALDVASANGPQGLTAAINGAGVAVVAWSAVVNASDDKISAAVRLAGGAFPGTPKLLNDGVFHASSPAVAVDGSGNVAVAYQWNPTMPPDAGERIAWRIRRTGQSDFDLVQRVSPAGTVPSQPQIAAGPAGFAVAWIENTSQSVEAGTGKALTGWDGESSVRTVSGRGVQPYSPHIAVSAAGATAITWALSGPTSTAEASVRAAGGNEFPTPSTLSDRVFGSIGPVGFDNEGNAAAAVVRTNNSGLGSIPRIAGYDAAPPAITGLAFPGRGFAGTPVGFAASVFDRWSPVNIAWSFGDGSAGAGASTSHAYANPGTYPLTMTATDAVGNASSATGAVGIAAPPGVDADGDGVPVPRDCNDHNKRIRPGAREIRGNKIDENCDGRASPFLVVNATASLTWDRLRSGKTRLKTLVVERVVSGEKVKLVCSGRGCRKKATRTLTVKRGKRKLSLTKYVRGMTLSPNAKLTITVTRTGFIARIYRYTMVNRRDPKKATRCLTPGQKRSRIC